MRLLSCRQAPADLVRQQASTVCLVVFRMLRSLERGLHVPKASTSFRGLPMMTDNGFVVLAENVVGINNRSTVPDTVGIVGCPEVHSVDCMFDGAARTLTYIVMVMLLVYVLLWTFYIGRASSKLRQRSYQM